MFNKSRIMKRIFLPAHPSLAELVLVIHVVFTLPSELELELLAVAADDMKTVSAVWKYLRLIFWKTTTCLLCMKLT